MAFPTIPTVAASRVLSVLATAPSGTHTSPSLTTLTNNAGDLLIAIVIIYDGNSTNAEFSSWGGGFTEFVDSATTTTMGIGAAYKWSDGTETGTFTVTSADATTNDSAFFLLSIPGAHATTPPEGGTIADGTTAAADPASFNPAGWAAEDTLWIAVGGSGETATTGSYTGIASAPANYTDYADSGISADVVGGVEGAVAFRQLNAASEDVGTFSVDVSNARNSALIIAVRPATTTDAAAENAAGTGSAFLASIALAVAAGLGAGSGTAYNASVDVQPNAGLASATGTAYNATVETAAGGISWGPWSVTFSNTVAAFTDANAGLASGTGAAGAASVSIQTNAGVAAASGAALAANIATTDDAPADTAQATAQAHAPSVSIALNAGSASGSGTAYNAIVSTSAVANAGVASGTGTAYDATVSVSGAAANANAGLASGTGTAYDATVTVPGGVVEGPPRHGPPLRAAIVTGPAERRHPHLRVHAEVARGTGTAYNATTIWDDDETAILLLLEAAQ